VGAAYLVSADGSVERTPDMAQVVLEPGQWLRGEHGGGGGYGDPRTRDPQLVLEDVLEGYVTVQAACDVYAVALTGDAEDGTATVDAAATARLRS
jgi:N-methylhydantoinase B